MTLGVVYCAVCESYPGRCKIGKTFRNAAQRIGELQRHYRSHHPFVEHDSKLVDHYSRVEWLAHQRLGYCREVATEMFVCTPAEAMAAIGWATEEALRNPLRYAPRAGARPRTLAKARGYYARRGNPWPLVLLCIGIIAYAARGMLPGLAEAVDDALQLAAIMPQHLSWWPN